MDTKNTYIQIQTGSNLFKNNLWISNHQYHVFGWLYALGMQEGTYPGSTECYSDGNMDTKTEVLLFVFS